MKTSIQNCFPHEVKSKLYHYVYRLIDPRNGETFYVGKGKGDRVFSHASGDIENDPLTEKLKRIRSIKIAGFEVAHVIHRHGMDEKTAFEVEAALLDAYPGLSNMAGGHRSHDYGVMHANEVIQKYCAKTATFRERVLLISVNRSALEDSLYESTRFAWRLSPRKAQQADIVLATVQGIIVGAFEVTKWLPATKENFPGKETIEGRYGFIGKEATENIKSVYVGKRVPEKYRLRGASNPIKYTW